MKTSPVTPEDLSRSVWAVPPLAATAAANRKLVRHIEAGGVSTILWGGNANVYNMVLPEMTELLARVPEWVDEATWAIPSVGPDFGRLRDHVRLLRDSQFPAALALPFPGPCDADGVEAALRHFVDASGVPVIPYLRRADYLRPGQLGAMIEDGVAVGIKYAVEPSDLSSDRYLEAILGEVPAARIVSGIGELAAIIHLATYHLAGFTSGAVCIAPRRATSVLRALQAGDTNTAVQLAEPIRVLEELRQTRGPVPVIHSAVTASGIADMGRIGPVFAQPDTELCALIAAAVTGLTEKATT